MRFPPWEWIHLILSFPILKVILLTQCLARPRKHNEVFRHFSCLVDVRSLLVFMPTLQCKFFKLYTFYTNTFYNIVHFKILKHITSSPPTWNRVGLGKVSARSLYKSRRTRYIAGLAGFNWPHGGCIQRLRHALAFTHTAKSP